VPDYGNFDPLGLGFDGPGAGTPWYWYPPDGLASPPVERGTDGLISFGTDAGERWWVLVGSIAWDRWKDQVFADGTSGISLYRGVEQSQGPTLGTVTLQVDPGGIETPPPPPMIPDVVNDPSAGPVIAGKPTDGGIASTLWRLPGSMVGRFMPPGPVGPVAGVVLLALPFGILALIAWWLYRKARR